MRVARCSAANMRAHICAVGGLASILQVFSVSARIPSKRRVRAHSKKTPLKSDTLTHPTGHNTCTYSRKGARAFDQHRNARAPLVRFAGDCFRFALARFASMHPSKPFVHMRCYTECYASCAARRTYTHYACARVAQQQANDPRVPSSTRGRRRRRRGAG